MHVSAIVAAGGLGQRMGGGIAKQFLEIGGRTLLDYSVDALVASSRIDEVVVAVPAEMRSSVAVAMQAARGDKPVSLVAGGRRRQDSVANAFALVADRSDLLVIHDAARPFLTADLIARTVDAAVEHGAAIAALRAHDTVKQAESGSADGPRFIRATLPRETIYLAQTPQAFRRDVLARAIAEGQADSDATDEAMLAERAGFRVQLVDGDPSNIKVTTPDDLEVARMRLTGSRPAALTRIGTGYDLHRLVAGRPLVLGGVTIPFELGLDGHSDADIVCHSVTDAVLGAAACGDIGRLFPDTDPVWKDADSLMMLGRAVDLVRRAGYAVVNVDVTVIAQRPKLLPYLDDMRANLARVLSVNVAAVSIKGKTNEHVDSMGRGESMAAHAVALITES